ncbi:type II toxin-antitoxin system VapC family toxin [Candidatus Poribacteria bacterium]|nr:type II toxin-antitoxin system VapC family toxin [Candidatus Poribacteria bacterium]
MNEVFADTSGWASFFREQERHHARAVALMTQWQEENRHVVTTNYVLGELIALCERLRVPRSRGVSYIQSIRAETWIEIVHIDEQLDVRAWELLENRLDKTWSLVDCASFVVMEQRGLTDALTTDHHFEQAGFVRLL